MPKLKNYKYCPHCQFEVHRSTYHRHHNLYHRDGKWVTSDDSDYEEGARNENNTDGTHTNTSFGHGHAERQSSNHEATEFMETNEEVCEEAKEMFNEDGTVTLDKTDEERRKQRLFLDTFVGEYQTEEETEITKECILDRLSEVWEDITFEDVKCDVLNESQLSSSNISAESSKALTLVNWIILFLSLWATFFNISNNAILHLLKFLKGFFEICGYTVPVMAIAASIFPISLHRFYKLQGTSEDNFVKYVVCPKCCFIYKYEDCIKKIGNKTLSKECSYVEYPNHPHFNKRQRCGTTLLKEILLKGNKTILYPRKTYCYRSVKTYLQSMLDRPGFAESLEQWRNRTDIPGTYRDVYDGRVWQNFKVFKSENGEERDFLNSPRNLAFMLNLDFFQPYKHTPYSVGVLYLVIMNLPREVRFKKNNVMLVGLIPGKSEPKKEQINFFLDPLVTDLELLWNEGILHNSEKYHAALLACACDLPAGRKLCGFLSFAAKIGCSKCTKEFAVGKFGEKTNYGGFNQVHTSRNYSEIKKQATKIKNAKTLSQRQAWEKSHGCRWSELMRLPYFDGTKFLMIDPMHGNFLGLTKWLIELWTSLDGLNKDQMEDVQHLIDCTTVPSDLGRIPYKIASHFAGFTSDQFKNFLLYFSIYVMKPHLPDKSYQLLLYYVEACYLYSRPVITTREISKAHELIMKFCRESEVLYTSDRITPNHHFQTHLLDSVLDYGPFYGFWLFSFERYNGLLGGYPTNNRSVEIQIMRRFIRGQDISQLDIPNEFQEKFLPLCTFSNEDEGSLLLNKVKNMSTSLLLTYLKIGNFPLQPNLPSCELFCDDSVMNLIGNGKTDFLQTGHHIDYLHKALEAFLGPLPREAISGAFVKYSNIEYMGDKYGSCDTGRGQNCHILASNWIGEDSEIRHSADDDRPGEIQYFLKILVPLNDSYKPVFLAQVNWFQKHSARNYYKTKLVTVWCKSMFEKDGPAMFMPIPKLKAKFISGFTKINGEMIRVVIPRIPKVYW